MKIHSIKVRIFCFILAVACFSVYLPVEAIQAFAATYKISGVAEDGDVYVDIDVYANHRTMGFLDVAKISNTTNRLMGDYKPDLKTGFLDEFPEYKHADIVEYEYFDKDKRENVYVKDNTSDYASKLEYLINNNIINRTTNYIYNQSGVYIGSGRVIHPNIEESGAVNDFTEDSIAQQNQSNKPRYYDPDIRISKTDFITELLKIAGVKQSRVIAVQTPYMRTSENLKGVSIDTEPVETSPYQRYMGELGIDSLNNDIIINHTVFRQLNLLVTNDVVESYLDEALKRGIITTDEIGGAEGIAFLGNRPNGQFSPPGSWYETKPVRQFYGEVTLSSKVLEQNGQYPEQLQQYLETVQKLIDQSETSDGLAYPWGNSYYYSIDECLFGKPTSTEPVEIVKRFSIVDVQQSLYDSLRNNIPSVEVDKGYQYFINEEITLAQAYVLAYKFMVSNGEEESMTEAEIDYINSQYALDFNNLLADELKAVRYLIAKGIIDPDVDDVNYSTSTPLTNETAIDLLYKVCNQNHRRAFTPSMTDLDKDMLDRGYSKSIVSVQSSGTGSSAGGIKGQYIDNNGSTKSLQSSLLDDRMTYPYNYNYLYVRYPVKAILSSNDTTDLEETLKNGTALSATIRMLTNDNYRLQIDPYNEKLNGGIKDETVQDVDEYGRPRVDGDGNPIMIPKWRTEIDVESGESMYYPEGGYVYKGADGYYWGRYIVDKNSSSNLRMLITFADGTVEEYTGFAGEGVYVLQQEKDTKYTKINLSQAQTSPFTSGSNNNLYSKVISVDIETRNYLNNPALSEMEKRANPQPQSDNIDNTAQAIPQSYTINNRQNSLQTSSTFNLTNKTLLTNTKVLLPTYTGITRASNNLVSNAINKTSSTGFTSSNIIRRPLYGETQQAQGYYLFGPFSAIDLNNLLLNGKQLVNNTSGTYEVNKEEFKNQPLIYSKVNFMEVTHEQLPDGTVTYYLKYTAQGTNLALETSEVMKLLEMRADINNGEVTKLPGYSKFSAGGEQVVLISKEELTSLAESDLKVVALSDKLLWNQSTGQRAFLNTDENFTLIGNNITRYPDNTVMVVGLGGRVFYNLDIVMELLNDTNAFCQKSGSNIYVSSRLENTMSDGVKYTNVPVYDNKGYTFIDKTYTFMDTGGIYVSLSALVDKCSNMIYFKDKTIPGLEMVVVYYPKITKEDVKNDTTTVVDNGVLGTINYQKINNGVSSMNNTKFKSSTAVLSSYLFSGGAGDNKDVITPEGKSVGKVASEVLPSGYQYNVYFLLDDTSETKIQSIWTDFSNRIQDISVGFGYNGINMLENAVISSEIPQTLSKKSPSSDSDVDSSNIAISVLKTSTTSFNSTNSSTGNYLFRDSGSNNLYFRIANSDNTHNSREFAGIFKNRIYGIANTSTVNTSSQLKPLAEDVPCLTFQQQKYYTKTPIGYVPLEIYANGSGTVDTLDKTHTPEVEQYYNKEHRINNSYANTGDIKASLANVKTSKITDASGEDSFVGDAYSGNLLINFPSGLKTALLKGYKTSNKDELPNQDAGVFTPVKNIDPQVFDNSLINSILNDTKDKEKRGFLDSFDNYMIKQFTSRYNSKNVTKVEGDATKSITKFALEASVQRSNFTAQNLVGLYLAGVSDTSPLGAYDTALGRQVEQTVAQMYNPMWELVDYSNQSSNTTEGSVTPSLFMDENGKLRELDTFSLDRDYYDYVITFHIGKPPREVMDTFIKKYRDEAIIKTTKFNDISSQLGVANSAYNSEDDGFAYFVITQYNKNSPSSAQIAAVAKLSHKDLANARMMNESDKLKYLWNTAWSKDEGKGTFYLDTCIIEELFLNIKIYEHAGTMIKERKNKIKDYDTMCEFFGKDEPTIYYQQMVAVPAGTTLIDREGSMVTLLSDHMRYELNYTGDIINSVLAKMMFDIDDVMFLTEVPENSMVVFPSIGKSAGDMMIKMSEAVPKPAKGWGASDGKSLAYVDMLSAPEFDDKNNPVMYSYDDVTDFTMAFQVLNSIYNIEIPTTGAGANNSVNGSRVKLGTIMGNGLWKLPTREQMNTIISTVETQYKQNESQLKLSGYDKFINTVSTGIAGIAKWFVGLFNTDEYIYYWAMQPEYDEMLIALNGKSKDEQTTVAKTYKDLINFDATTSTFIVDAVLYKYNITKKTSEIVMEDFSEYNGDLGTYQLGHILPVVSLPPTLVVEEKSDGNTKYYEIKYYVNPSIYGIDVKGSYVSYLNERNTPAYDPTATLTGARSNNMDGHMFKKYALTMRIDIAFQVVLSVIRWALPMLLLALWGITTILYGWTKYISITHYAFSVISDILCVDVVKFLTLGVVDLSSDRSMARYIIYSICIWTLAALLCTNYLQTMVILAWDWIMNLVV